MTIQDLLRTIRDNIEDKACNPDLTGDQVTCILTVADAIDETIKEYS